MLFGEPRSTLVPDHGTPNPAESVGNDGFVSASAHDNTKWVLTFGNGPCRCADKVRVVYRVGGMGSEILNLDTF